MGAGLAGRGHEVRSFRGRARRKLPDPARLIGWRLPTSGASLRERERRCPPGSPVLSSRRHRGAFSPNYGFARASGAKPMMLVGWGSDLLRNADRTPFRQRARALRAAPRGSDPRGRRQSEQAAIRHGADPGKVWTRPWGIDRGLRGTGRLVGCAAGGPLRILWMRQLQPVYDPATFVRALAAPARKGVPFRATPAPARSRPRSRLSPPRPGFGIRSRSRMGG